MKKFFLIAVTAIFLLEACNSKKEEDKNKKEGMETSMESKEERNKKVVMASMEAFHKNDMEGVFKDAAASFTE